MKEKEGSMKRKEGSMKESSMKEEGSMKEGEHIASDTNRHLWNFYPIIADPDPLRMKTQQPTKSHKVVKKGTGSSGARRAIRNKSHRGGRKSRRNKRKSRKNRC